MWANRIFACRNAINVEKFFIKSTKTDQIKWWEVWISQENDVRQTWVYHQKRTLKLFKVWKSPIK